MSFRRLAVIVVFCSLVLTPTAQERRPDPESPRFKGLMALGQFLRSSGPEAVTEFIEERVSSTLRKQHSDAELAEKLDQLREEFRGISPRGGEPLGQYSAAISFPSSGKKGRSRLAFAVEAEPPHRFVEIDFGPAVPAPQAEEFSSEELPQLIESISEALRGGYIYEENGRRMAELLQMKLGAGEYQSLTSPGDLADRLTRDLQEFSRDRHLRIRYAPGDSNSQPGRSRMTPHADHRRASGDLGFAGTQVLDGKVGYLELSRFDGSPEALARADEVMKQFAGIKALIIDLRRNGGGSEPMVKHLSAYLFAEPTHLVDTFQRGWDVPRERWTSKEIEGDPLPDIPVYILISRNTFSAAESFTFGLKVNQRATLVGERTGGGGHFGGVEPLTHGFSIWLPKGRTYDPRTGQGWEAEGIQPDIEAPAEDALDVAHRRALLEIEKSH